MKTINILWLTIVLVLTFGTVSADTLCFKCHSKKDFTGAVVHEPVSEANCTVCHNPHVARFKGLLQRDVASLCYECHDSVVDPNNKLFQHKPVRLGECLACHDPHTSDGKGLLKEKESGRWLLCLS